MMRDLCRWHCCTLRCLPCIVSPGNGHSKVSDAQALHEGDVLFIAVIKVHCHVPSVVVVGLASVCKGVPDAGTAPALVPCTLNLSTLIVIDTPCEPLCTHLVGSGGGAIPKGVGRLWWHAIRGRTLREWAVGGTVTAHGTRCCDGVQAACVFERWLMMHRTVATWGFSTTRYHKHKRNYEIHHCVGFLGTTWSALQHLCRT